MEYEALRMAAGDFNEGNATNLDGLLLTGARYVEARRIQEHPEWFDGNHVILPRWAQQKAMSKQDERWIRICPGKVGVFRLFLANQRLTPSWEGWTANLKRWARVAGLDPVGLGPKTTRKTYESWLAFSYPERLVFITLRQGHTSATQAKFYLNMPFLPEDVQAMKPWTEGVF